MTKPAATTAVELPAAGTYRLDPAASTVEFVTTHLFGLGKVRGHFGLTSGELTVATPPTGSSVSVEIPAASFDSANAKRDEKVTAAGLLDAASFPAITFRSTGIRQDGGRWITVGDLTAHGVAAPVELTVTGAALDGPRVTVTATTTVDRYAHGITAMKGMAGRRLELTLTAVYHAA